MELIDIIKTLKTKPDYHTLRSEILDWAIENLFSENKTDIYPILWFVTQEPEYELWKTLSDFLKKEHYRSMFTYETRFGLYLDLKRWLVKKIKENNIIGL